VSSREDWQRRLGPLYGGAVALVHSTPWRWPVEVADEPRSPAWLVVLGLPVGALAWVAAALAQGVGIPLPVCALIGIAALTIGGAALGERGLVEQVDRWQDAGDGAERAGDGPRTTAAVIALVLVTGARIGAVIAIAPADWLALFLAVAVAGRWAAVLLQALGDPIAEPGARRSLVAAPAPAWLTAALTAAVAALAVAALGGAGIAALGVAGALALGLGIDAQRRDGGLTATGVAFVGALAELIMLLVATIALP
jgi:hypothetical protein